MGDLLYSRSSASGALYYENRIERWTTGGAKIGDFAVGIIFPGQLSVMSDNSVLVTSWYPNSSINGIHHLASDGSTIRFVSTSVLGNVIPRAAYVLGDGNYLVATNYGIYKYWLANESFQQVVAGPEANARSITLVPEPTALWLLPVLMLSIRWYAPTRSPIPQFGNMLAHCDR